MAYAENMFEGATHVARIGAFEIFFEQGSFDEACQDLIGRAGGGVPQVTELSVGSDGTIDVQPVLPKKGLGSINGALRQARETPVIAGGEMDVVGKLRSEVDKQAAEDAGFSVKESLYARGTRVIQWGVDNAETSRLDHESKPLVVDYCDEFVETIREEERRDEQVRCYGMRMDKAARLVHPANGARRPMTRGAFNSLLQRSGVGGQGYLSKCWPELRAMNVNRWMDKFETDEKISRETAMREGRDPEDPRVLTLRTRNREDDDGLGDREVFGVVSEKYTSFDVDRIAAALKLACEEAAGDARGTVTYDGNKARFEVMFHSDVRPEEYVAGEFFKAGVIIRTDDTGGSSVRVNSAVWQNLCLNLIIVDRAEKGVARIKHTGSVEVLARKFQDGFKEALGTIRHFRKAWGYALHEDVLARTAATTSEPIEDLSLNAVLPGIFNAVIERELVPVRGRRKEIVRGLMQMYQEDTSAAVEGRDQVLSRAAVVNAFTRYAHRVEGARGPWGEDSIQASAGRLLYGRRKGQEPEPLPYLPIGL